MTHFAALAFSIVLSMGLLTWICLSRARRKALTVTVFTVLTVGAFAASVESTGQPKPVLLEWRNIDEAEVVGLTWNEELKRVWVWVMRDGEPVAYVLPWPADKKHMGTLQDRWRRKGSTGDEFRYDAEGEVARVVEPEPMPEKQQ